MDNQQQQFKNWCIIELFGHSKIAGYCTEQNIAGTNFLRIDVPQTESQQPFTKYYGANAIYSINPVDEVTARIAAEKLEIAPVSVWQGGIFTEQYQKKIAAAPHPVVEDDDEYHEPF